MKTHRQFKSKGRVVWILVILVLSSAQITFAQSSWSLEFRPGLNYATKKLGEATLKTGFGLEGTLAYNFIPQLGIYGGWSWNKFGSNQSISGTYLDFEETGYTYGLQFIQPIGGSRISLLLSAGGLYNHIEVEKDEDIISDSGHGLGWQIEGGLAFPLGNKLSWSPNIRYRTLSRDIKPETVNTPVELNYISVGLSLAVKF